MSEQTGCEMGFLPSCNRDSHMEISASLSQTEVSPCFCQTGVRIRPARSRPVPPPHPEVSLCVSGSLGLPPLILPLIHNPHLFLVISASLVFICLRPSQVPQYLTTCSASRERCLYTVISVNSFSFLLQRERGQPQRASSCERNGTGV